MPALAIGGTVFYLKNLDLVTLPFKDEKVQEKDRKRGKITKAGELKALAPILLIDSD